MASPKRNYRKRYDEIMRSAGERRKRLAERSLYLERVYQAELKKALRGQLRHHKDFLSLSLVQTELEVESLEAQIELTQDVHERILLKSELSHLTKIRDRLRGRDGPKKPPEAGIPVPAILPNGPLPKQGGAEAPLDSGT